MRRLALVLLPAVLAACSTGATGTSASAPSVASSEISAAASSPSGSVHAASATPAAHLTSHATSGRPVIVLDPGHSPAVHAIDKATGLDVSDYANEPEMRDVFAVAQLARKKLVKDGYRVVMTKKSVGSRVSLAHRAAIANHAHAALAISIHDQAGSAGGIGYRAGNNIVYYQSVGKYRTTPGGKKIVFTNRAIAKKSKRYAKIFRSTRAVTEHTSVRLLGDIGYNMASRGLPAGNMWMVQLLSHVPWVYNEVGGNSAGRVGLSSADKHNYATALVRSIEKCVPLR